MLSSHSDLKAADW